MDDILIASNSWSDIVEMKSHLHAEFDMKDLGHVRKI